MSSDGQGHACTEVQIKERVTHCNDAQLSLIIRLFFAISHQKSLPLPANSQTMEQKFGKNSIDIKALREFCEREGEVVTYRKGDQLEREGSLRADAAFPLIY